MPNGQWKLYSRGLTALEGVIFYEVRMSLSKKLRFDVFKRDDFQCQYCGRRSPDVILEVDHVIPKSKGGVDETENLVTACFYCNRGKAANKLSKKKMQRNMAEAAKLEKERGEQLKEYYKYKNKIAARLNKIVDNIDTYIFKDNKKYQLGVDTRRSVKQLLNKGFIPQDIKDAWDIANSKLWDKDFYPKFRYMCGVLYRSRERGEL